MLFVLKKIISGFLYPISIVLIILGFGVYGLLFKPKSKKNVFLVFLGFALLVVFSFEQGKSFLGIKSYQWEYTPVNPVIESIEQSPKWIIVLGGGHVGDNRLPASMQLSLDSLARVFEAIRLYHLLDNVKIIVSGAAVFDKKTNAQTAKEALMEAGIPEKDIVLNDKSKDTLNEARDISKIVGQDLCYLVTSAIHMKRSAKFFSKKNVNFIPAPTAYINKQRNATSVRQFFPQAGEIQAVERYVHEVLGTLWAYVLDITGKI